MKSFFLVLFAFFSPAAYPQTPWPSEVYQSYFNQCKIAMYEQAMPDQKSNGICYCLSSGFSKEFGMEQYNHLRSAKPNPNGNSYDRKLFKVVSNCMKK